MAEANVRQIERLLIKEVANILSMDPATLTVDTPFHSLGMSSMAFVELLVVIDEILDVKLMETDLKKEDFQRVGTLALRISKVK